MLFLNPSSIRDTLLLFGLAPEDKVKPAPKGVPRQFFTNEPEKIPSNLLAEIQKRAIGCARKWGHDQMGYCSIFAAVKLAPQNSEHLNSAKIRAWAKDELARFYEEYLKNSPKQRAETKYFILTQDLDKILLTPQFGKPLTGKEIEKILAKVRSKTGLSHTPPARKTPITWEEINSSTEPVEVRTQDIPQDLQTLAKQMKLPKGFSEGKDLWDFISANTDAVSFAKHLPSSSSAPMIAEAKTFYFKTVVIDVHASGDIYKNDFLAGILSNLAHECYHNYYHHHLMTKDELYIDAYMLNERNAYLLGAETVIQYIRQKLASGVNREYLKDTIAAAANDLVIGLAANACLGYEKLDRRLHVDIPAGADKKAFNSHPIGCVGRYFTSLGMDKTQFFNQLMDQLEFF